VGKTSTSDYPRWLIAGKRGFSVGTGATGGDADGGFRFFDKERTPGREPALFIQGVWALIWVGPLSLRQFPGLKDPPMAALIPPLP